MLVAVERALRAHEKGQDFQDALEQNLQLWTCEHALERAMREGRVKVSGVDNDGVRRWAALL